MEYRLWMNLCQANRSKLDPPIVPLEYLLRKRQERYALLYKILQRQIL